MEFIFALLSPRAFGSSFAKYWKDGSKLDNLEFNIELSIVVPFPSPSEALRVGTKGNIFSHGHGWWWIGQTAM